MAKELTDGRSVARERRLVRANCAVIDRDLLAFRQGKPESARIVRFRTLKPPWAVLGHRRAFSQSGLHRTKGACLEILASVYRNHNKIATR